MVDIPDFNDFQNVDLSDNVKTPQSASLPLQKSFGRCFINHFATKENLCLNIIGLLSIGSSAGLGYLVKNSLLDKNIKTNIQIKTSQYLGAFIALVLAGAGTYLIVNSVRQAINLTRQEIENGEGNLGDEEPLLGLG